MSNAVVPIKIKGVMPTASGCAVFLGPENKTFVIHLDPNMGLALTMCLQDVQKERPLTHDLIQTIFVGLGIALEHIVINDVKNATFYARIILSMKNELGSKIVEIDARPSDALVLALQADKPIFVAHGVMDQVEDVTEVLNKLLDDQDKS